MTARRNKRIDPKNFIIAALIFIVGIESYFLYQSNENFREFFIHSSKSAPLSKKITKKERAPVERSAFTPVIEDEPEVIARVPAAAVPKKNSTDGKKAFIAIVIDDWGYSTKNCQYLREIKSPISVAVLPDLPHSGDVMQCAHEAGKEIMLHLPMEAHNNSDEYPPDYLLKTNMSPIKVDHLLSNILDKMPLVAGVNNHMGSKATEDKIMMSTVFKQLKHRGLFFMDSRVTSKSVCAPLARQSGVPFASRDVFLDNVNEPTAVQKRLADLVKIAKKRGKALAIGHDRALTLQAIKESVPTFKDQGIELVTVKEYINLK